MDIYTPTKIYLDGCKHKELMALAEISGVPYTTIIKIKTGETKNPGVLTTQKLFEHIPNTTGKERRRSPGRRESDKQMGRRTRKSD